MTDTELVNWLEKEGFESIVRCGNLSTGVKWTSLFTPGEYYQTFRQACIASFIASFNEPL